MNIALEEALKDLFGGSKATPEQSDRQIAKALGVHHTTVTTQCKELEENGDVEKFTTSLEKFTNTTGLQRRELEATAEIPQFDISTGKIHQFDDELHSLFEVTQKEIEKPLSVSENAHFSLQEKLKPQNEYMMSEDYMRVKVRHWKEEYILTEITNPVAVGLYALFRAYHAERGHTPLSLNTSYVYLREDTGDFISAEERKKLGRDVHTTKILYGLQELYRRSGGGSSDYQLAQALEQLTDAGYLIYDGAGYKASEKQPERLYNADEFLSFSKASGIAVSFSPTGSLTLEGDNEGAKQRLQHMLDYSRSLGIPDKLKCTIIDRLKGRPVFYDE